MKKLLLTLVCLISLTCAVSAQEAKVKKQSFIAEMGLSKEQGDKYKLIVEKSKADIATSEADATLDDKAKKAKKKLITKARDEEVQLLLTDEQKVKFKAYEERKKAEKEAKKANG